MNFTKFIFVTGGVVSSLGKGITSASIGALLESQGLQVSILKLDPYLNVDPGTMNPSQHGEVFVTDDGVETDLDLGHYERFISTKLTKINCKTAGQIYLEVIKQERLGKYLGKTVQVVPHITNEIKKTIFNAGKNYDILICEIGGTVGDIESLPFIESIRQIRQEKGQTTTLFIHVSYLPFLSTVNEIKTKPTQHSVKQLLNAGVQPDILILRAEKYIPNQIKLKISTFCNIKSDHIIRCSNVDTIYAVPLLLYKEKISEFILLHFNIKANKPNLKNWKRIVKRFRNPKKIVNIGVIGKYTESAENYKSINEALIHAGISCNTKIRFYYIDSEKSNSNEIQKSLYNLNGILIPPGFGKRGMQGKLIAIQYARENKIPFFGICLGLQMAVIEFARNVLKLSEATSEEFNAKAKIKIIHLLDNQKNLTKIGGTMRLGSFPCILQTATLAYRIYKKKEISERHRHRYEINCHYKTILESAGMIFSGRSPNGKLIEIIELQNHPFFIGTQFHPEFTSKPLEPHPIFKEFINAAIKNEKQIK